MGCDIHAFVEYRDGESWRAFSEEINLSRHYGAFAALAGVRNNPAWGLATLEPKGLPDDASYITLDNYKYFITDETNFDGGYVSHADAQKWIAEGVSHMIDERWVSDPDAHTPSHLTTEEFEGAIMQQDLELISTRDDVEYLATLGLMKHLEKNGYKARLVFWFDN